MKAWRKLRNLSTKARDMWQHVGRRILGSLEEMNLELKTLTLISYGARSVGGGDCGKLGTFLRVFALWFVFSSLFSVFPFPCSNWILTRDFEFRAFKKALNLKNSPTFQMCCRNVPTVMCFWNSPAARMCLCLRFPGTITVDNHLHTHTRYI